MSRILFSTTLGASVWAGSEVLWFQAASRLAAEGYQVAAVLPRHMRTRENLVRFQQRGITVLSGVADHPRSLAVRIGRRARPSAPTPLAAMVRHAGRWRADVVVISQSSCWGAYSEILALAEKRIPYVCLSQLNTPFSWPGDQLFEAVGEAFAKAAAAVFVSQGNLDLFENQVARKLDNAQVIYNPPSIDVSQPCGPVLAHPFRLLNVARIDPGHKGQDLLLDVLALPKWRKRQIELEIAGGGNSRWLERLLVVKGLTNVTLLGHVSDLRALWERASFGVFPSRYEGMPLAMIEGMALGRAIIATDVAGHAEWIDDGTNGFLATGCTVLALDQALERAWQRRKDASLMGDVARGTATRIMPSPPAEQLARLIKDAFVRKEEDSSGQRDGRD